MNWSASLRYQSGPLELWTGGVKEKDSTKSVSVGVCAVGLCAWIRFATKWISISWQRAIDIKRLLGL